MNIIYKYKTAITLADVAATNDANAVTGFAAGGGYNGSIGGFTAVGVIVPTAAGMGVGSIPTNVATYEGAMETSRVYDVLLKGMTVVANQPHIYKLPLSVLGVDPVNQKINSIQLLNSFDPATGDIFPISDRFFYKYNFSGKAIYFGFPHADIGLYNNMGLKIQITLISANV